MVKSDGDDSYTINKFLWKAMVTTVVILLGIAGAWGMVIVSDVKQNVKDIQANSAADAVRDERLRSFKEQMDRIETGVNVLTAGLAKK